MAFANAVAVPPTAYPPPPVDLLRQSFVGRDVRDIDGPAAVIDVAVVRKNCDVMLKAIGSLGLGFRAHVKTHKTTQVARMQIGDDVSRPAQFVVSTLQEAEMLVPLLSEYKEKGRRVNVWFASHFSGV